MKTQGQRSGDEQGRGKKKERIVGSGRSLDLLTTAEMAEIVQRWRRCWPALVGMGVRMKLWVIENGVGITGFECTPCPEVDENSTVEDLRKRSKWDNDDYICRGHILNGISDSLFDIYQNLESAKELWDQLESKYIDEDASSKKFLVGNFMNYKMSDARPVMEQFNELLRILGQFPQHDMEMPESISVSSIIDKLPPQWKDFKHTLKHKKEEMSLTDLGKSLRIEESIRAQESAKTKDAGKTMSINMMDIGEGSNYDRKGKKRPHNGKDKTDNPDKKSKTGCWICGKTGHLKRDCKFAKKGLDQKGKMKLDKGLRTKVLQNKDDDLSWWIDSGATKHVCKDRGWFTKYVPAKDGTIIYMGNESTAEIQGCGDVNLCLSSGKVVCLKNVLHVPSIRKNLVSSGQLSRCGYKQVIESDCYVLSKCGVFIGFGYLCNGSRDEVGSQYAYCYNIDEDPRTFDEAMKSHDVSFWKEAINDEMDSILGNNTWVLTDLPRGCKPLGCKWIFKRKTKVDGTIDKYKARLVIQGFRQKEGIDYFDTYAPVARICTIRLLIAIAAIRNLVIHQIHVKTAFLNGDLEEEIYMKQPEGFIMPGNEHKICKLVKSLYGLKQAPKQ
ncbi:uncharacterized protein LOC141628544 [Silene latifolia]|uniref:uncharacterized protein LOC141628544 n=1 Tax=Silene latifolia TaxID=37657 RepID=UPI003D77B27C